MNFYHFGGDSLLIKLKMLVKSHTDHDLIDGWQNLQVNPLQNPSKLPDLSLFLVIKKLL